MKNYKNTLLYTVFFIILMTLAIWGYNYLKEKYTNDEIKQNYGEAEVNDIIETMEKAKNFKTVNYDGKEVNLSDYFGKPIIVNFWETWCSPCKLELPEFNKVYLKHKDNIEFMMVNLTDGYKGDTQSVKNFINNNGYQFPVYFDVNNSAANAYSIFSIPKTIFIDKDGNIAYTFLGILTEEKLEEYINKLIK